VKSSADEESEAFAVFYRVGGFRHHADDGAVHLRAGFEDCAAYLEQIFHITEGLHLHGEDAVLLRAGHGGDALGDFVLHHQRGGRDQVPVVEKAEENRAGDGVGDVAGQSGDVLLGVSGIVLGIVSRCRISLKSSLQKS